MFYTNSKSYIFQNPKNNQEANAAVHVQQVKFVASMSMSVDHPVKSRITSIVESSKPPDWPRNTDTARYLKLDFSKL